MKKNTMHAAAPCPTSSTPGRRRLENFTLTSREKGRKRYLLDSSSIG